VNRPDLKALCLAALLSAPAFAVDSLVVGDTGWQSWRSAQQETRRMTVTHDAIAKWEVAPNVNLGPGTLRRGGRIAVIPGGSYWVDDDDIPRPGGTALFEAPIRDPFRAAALLLDGDATTAFDPDEYEAPRASAIHIDLGEVFRVNRVRLYPRLDRQHSIRFPQVLQISTYDGSDEGVPMVMDANSAMACFRQVKDFPREERNPAPIVDELMVSRDVRYMRIDIREERAWELAEVEVYSDGTLPMGEYVSRPLAGAGVFDYEGVVWGRVRSESGSVSQLPLTLQTRTGPTPDPVLHYRLSGIEGGMRLVPPGVYDQLLPEEKGPVEPNPDWSAWATVTDGVVRSPSPSRYIQFRVLMAQPGTAVRRLIFEFIQKPLALQLQAEIDPIVAEAGEETTFELSIQVYMLTEKLKRITSDGFRRIRVKTAAAVSRVEEVFVRGESALHTVTYQPGEGFTVHLGQRIVRDGTFVQITFCGAVFRDGTQFEVQAMGHVVSGTRLDTVYQVAQPANVDPTTPGGELTVRLEGVDQIEGLLVNARSEPEIITPNRDGVNDRARICYDLLKLTRPGWVTVDVHDLSGRRLRRLFEGEEMSGQYAHPWNGTDERGLGVPAGMYIYRIEAQAGSMTDVAKGVVGVAY